ncbi:amidohydrolase family protein [Dyadobacter sandarakinus]|uniref:Amidohydrolase family protein n=1 Tax=Dyadobacter sandarakinus TaxID=2747268 RepID=A0ABX7IEG0_9BACT|nr:amidohydrolase family protein [Dyadobacter sandarakinus]QRR03922.1 amidohydrolase family protein [Dyadobacter sandarakinus]
MTIDSHQHFWVYDEERDAWITPDMQVIRRNFLPADLKPVLDANHVSGCVAVQAGQSDSETEFLLQCAEANDFIKGVVGWIDLRSEGLYERLERYSQFEKLKGFRHVVQAEPAGFLLQSEFMRGVGQLVAFDFTYDILIYQHQLAEAAQFAARLPNVRFVLDHLAKPDIKNGDITQWAGGIRELAELPNVYCKLSGMVTEAHWNEWEKADFRPYLDVAVEAFGTDRLMFGSDWPVCLVAAEYEGAKGILTDYLSMFSDAEMKQVMGGNAVEFYNLDMY